MQARTRFDKFAYWLSRLGITATATRLRGRRLMTLCYHGVTPRFSSDDEFTVTGHIPVATFQRRMEWLANHMKFVTLDMVLGALERGHKLPRRAVLITFDDGFLNNIEFAMPVMRNMNIRPVQFIPSEAMEANAQLWYERLGLIVGWTRKERLAIPGESGEGPAIDTVAGRRQAYEQLFTKLSHKNRNDRENFLRELQAANSPAEPPAEALALFYKHLSWDQLKKTAEHMDIGGHTISHPALSRIDENESRGEIAGNFRHLADRLGAAPSAFAYPFGSRSFFGAREESFVREAGYRMAFSLVPPHGEPDSRYAMPRRNIYRVSFEVISLLISGLADRPMKWLGKQ